MLFSLRDPPTATARVISPHLRRRYSRLFIPWDRTVTSASVIYNPLHEYGNGPFVFTQSPPSALLSYRRCSLSLYLFTCQRPRLWRPKKLLGLNYLYQHPLKTVRGPQHNLPPPANTQLTVPGLGKVHRDGRSTRDANRFVRREHHPGCYIKDTTGGSNWCTYTLILEVLLL